jgi:hypothetical protein
VRKLGRKGQLGRPNRNEWILLRRVLDKYNFVVWIGFVWLMIEIIGGLL